MCAHPQRRGSEGSYAGHSVTLSNDLFFEQFSIVEIILENNREFSETSLPYIIRCEPFLMSYHIYLFSHCVLDQPVLTISSA